jgi:NTP pyrophosphatase (non-canonical NTP hydrolase)
MGNKRMLDKLQAVNRGLNRRFPDGNTPFQMMTRLLEECGELAEQVNHFEGTGVKRLKHGEPDKAKLAKEAMDVLRCVFQVVAYYDVEDELRAAIDRSYQKMAQEGLIDPQ